MQGAGSEPAQGGFAESSAVSHASEFPADGLVLAVAPIVVVSGFGFRALHHHESPQPDVRDLPRVAAVPGVE